MSDRVTTNFSIDELALKEKLTNLIVDPNVRREIHNTFARIINPWVPFLEGPLSQTLEITPDYVRYVVPYAHYQYYGVNFNHTIEYHPLASAQWDKVAMQTERENFIEHVREILRRKAKELYGRR